MSRRVPFEVPQLSPDEHLEAMLAAIDTGTPRTHLSLNASKVVMARADRTLRDALHASALGVDGISVQWALGHQERTTGIDLAESLLAALETRGGSVALLGAQECVLDALQQQLSSRVNVRFAHHGFFPPHQERELAEQIAATQADALFVALGSPAAEHFLHRWRDHLGVPARIAVGGSFDVWTNTARRAPAAVRSAGLEWLWRVVGSPRKRARRGILHSLQFLASP